MLEAGYQAEGDLVVHLEAGIQGEGYQVVTLAEVLKGRTAEEGCQELVGGSEIYLVASTVVQLLC